MISAAVYFPHCVFLHVFQWHYKICKEAAMNTGSTRLMFYINGLYTLLLI